MRARVLNGSTMTVVEPLRVVFVGWGSIARATVGLLGDAPIRVVAVAERRGTPAPPDLPAGARLLIDPDDLAELQSDVVVEAAGRDAVGPWGRAALGSGADLVVSSTSALADEALRAELEGLAVENGARVVVQPGALGGVDALSAARAMGIDDVEHRIVKPPGAWLGTPAEEGHDLGSLDEPVEIFRGTASEAASSFPLNANVAMTTALAGIGPERTKVTLVADPAATGNRHEISATGDFGRLAVTIDNQPLPDNPKTSAMAALNLARCLRNRVEPFVI